MQPVQVFTNPKLIRVGGYPAGNYKIPTRRGATFRGFDHLLFELWGCFSGYYKDRLNTLQCHLAARICRFSRTLGDFYGLLALAAHTGGVDAQTYHLPANSGQTSSGKFVSKYEAAPYLYKQDLLWSGRHQLFHLRALEHPTLHKPPSTTNSTAMDIFSTLDFPSSRPTVTTSEDEGIPTDDLILTIPYPSCVVA